MHHIIYLSQATVPLAEEELAALLDVARVNNHRRNITGAMIYSGGQFLQLLEGDEADLADLYSTLLQDGRHMALIKLADKPIAHRSFTGWSMAFRAAAPDHFAQLTGYLLPEQLNFTPASLSSTDTNLLDLLLIMLSVPEH